VKGYNKIQWSRTSIFGKTRFIDIRWNVPGSFELIYGCKKSKLETQNVDAVIAIR
jgi:6,7-dimethyl-8-ribityllumazine synthase